MSALKRMMTLKMQKTLLSACQTHALDDATRVDDVAIRSAKPGQRLVLTIRYFDPEELGGWTDGTMGNKAMQNNLGVQLPPGLIGGDTFEQIKGIVQLDANLTKTKEDVDGADEIIQGVLARAKAALRGRWWRNLKDEYGEQVVVFRVAGGMELDSGANNANVSHYFLRWAAFTEAPAGQLDKLVLDEQGA